MPCRRGSPWPQHGSWRQNQDLGPAEGGALTTGTRPDQGFASPPSTVTTVSSSDYGWTQRGSAVGRHPTAAWLGAVGQDVLMHLPGRWCRPVLGDSGATRLQLAGLS